MTLVIRAVLAISTTLMSNDKYTDPVSVFLLISALMLLAIGLTYPPFEHPIANQFRGAYYH